MKTKNKSFKRLFAFLVALVMVTALVPSVIFAADSFTDVKSTDWFYEHVENLAAGNVIGGYPDGTFRPNNPVTRQEAAKMIALGAKTPAASGTEFTDLLGNWADPYIMALEADGAVSGFAGTKEFKPLENIKRGHVAKMIALAFGLKEGSEDYDLTDIKGVDNEEYIKILASNGIVGGFKGTTLFKPNELVTRAQMAKMIDVAMNPVDSTFRVLDVRAINAKKLEVTFSGKVNETEAKAPGTYDAVGLTLPSAATSYVLQDDEKTVVITLNNAIVNGTTFVFTVNPVAAKAPSDDETEIFSKTITFSDTVRPAVKEVKYPAYGQAEIVFTEELSEIGTNDSGKVTAVVPVTHDTTVSTFEQVAFAANDDKLVFSGLQKDLEYEVTIVGAKDQTGNLITPNPTVVTLKNTLPKDEVKPVLVSAKALSNNKVEFKFSKDLDGAQVTLGSIKYNNVALSSPDTAAVQTDKTVLLVTLGTANELAAAPFTFAAGAVEDTSGNGNAAFTELVKFNVDKDGPVKVKQEVKAGAAEDAPNELHITFDEDIVIPGASDALTFKFVDKFGVDQSYTVDKATVKGSGADAKVAVIALKGKLNGADPAVDLPDTNNYTVEFAKGYFEDGFGNDSAKFSVQVINVTTPTSTKLPAPSIAEKKDEGVAVPGVIVVAFSEAVNAAEAKTLSNYAVEGFTIEKVSLIANSNVAPKGAAIELTLADDSVKVGGSYNVTVKGISGYDAAYSTMNPFTKDVELTENVRPTIVSAKAIAFDATEGNEKTTVTLTFSEEVTSTVTTAKAHYELYIDGVKQTTNVTITPVVSGATTGVMVIAKDLSADLAAGKSITLEYVTGNDIVDSSGNGIVDASVTLK